jgi:hypothetical protein
MHEQLPYEPSDTRTQCTASFAPYHSASAHSPRVMALLETHCEPYGKRVDVNRCDLGTVQRRQSIGENGLRPAKQKITRPTSAHSCRLARPIWSARLHRYLKTRYFPLMWFLVPGNATAAVLPLLGAKILKDGRCQEAQVHTKAWYLWRLLLFWIFLGVIWIVATSTVNSASHHAPQQHGEEARHTAD